MAAPATIFCVCGTSRSTACRMWWSTPIPPSRWKSLSIMRRSISSRCMSTAAAAPLPAAWSPSRAASRWICESASIRSSASMRWTRPSRCRRGFPAPRWRKPCRMPPIALAPSGSIPAAISPSPSSTAAWAAGWSPAARARTAPTMAPSPISSFRRSTPPPSAASSLPIIPGRPPAPISTRS